MFLQPLKSQGVNRVDDSAFIVRVKFMAKPSGEAFILRRHVFQHIQETFHKNEIGFAVRHVVVEGENKRAAASADVTLFPSGNRANRLGRRELFLCRKAPQIAGSVGNPDNRNRNWPTNMAMPF